MLGPLDDDERAMFQTLVSHFILLLNDERGVVADLRRRLELADQRIRLLEASYGLF